MSEIEDIKKTIKLLTLQCQQQLDVLDSLNKRLEDVPSKVARKRRDLKSQRVLEAENHLINRKWKRQNNITKF